MELSGIDSLLLEGAQREYSDRLKAWADFTMSTTQLNDKSKKVFAKWLLDAVMDHFIENFSTQMMDVSKYPNNATTRYYLNLYRPKKYIEALLDGGKRSNKRVKEIIRDELSQVEPNVIAGQDEWFKRNYNNMVTTIRDWINGNVQNGRMVNESGQPIDIRNYTLDQAFQESEQWHTALKASGEVMNEEGRIIMKFPDGFYWIDLQTSNCREEADAMGHCANTNADTLLSLRKNKKPHVTVAYNYGDENYKDVDVHERNEGDDEFVKGGSYQQCKGKQNDKPDEKYHPYILALFKKLEVKEYKPEYNPENDFRLSDLDEETIEGLVKEKFPLVMNDVGLLLRLYGEKKIGFEYFKNFRSPYINFYENGVEIAFKADYSDFDNIFDSDQENYLSKYLKGDIDWEPYDYGYMDWSYATDHISEINETNMSTIREIATSLIGEELNEYDDITDAIKDRDNELAEIRDAILDAVRRTQESADQSEVYKMVHNHAQEMLGYVGNPEYKTFKKGDKEEEYVVMKFTYNRIAEVWDQYMEHNKDEDYAYHEEVNFKLIPTMFDVIFAEGYTNSEKHIDLDNVYGDFEEDVFNEILGDALSDIDVPSPKDKEKAEGQQFFKGMEGLDRIKELAGLNG